MVQMTVASSPDSSETGWIWFRVWFLQEPPDVFFFVTKVLHVDLARAILGQNQLKSHLKDINNPERLWLGQDSMEIIGAIHYT